MSIDPPPKWIRVPARELIEHFNERAGIFQFDAGLKRDEAEMKAYRLIDKTYRVFKLNLGDKNRIDKEFTG